MPPNPPAPPLPPPPPLRPQPPGRWAAFSATVVRAYHAYGGWLVTISWWKFIALSVLLLIMSGILQNIPPFNIRLPTLTRVDGVPTPPTPPKPREPVIHIERSKKTTPAEGAASGVTATKGEVQISINGDGIFVRRAPAAANASSAASAASPGLEIGPDGIEIKVPPGADSEVVREAVREARDQIKEAIEAAADAAAEAAAESGASGDVTVNITPHGRRLDYFTLGDELPTLAFLWIAMSIILKITYKGRLQAEVKAAQATETAEAEQLKRQVVEARMAAMQAQVEPHFLFNTLASIDHLIETDPARASVMQKNLIALLRASMPTMREANGSGSGVRDLGREMAVIQPYLEILKVRMEDRLATEIDVPEGLRSAAFPPMMIQSLVENAIKHGLEPKPEGGRLSVAAQIVHGKLAVTVADTGVGFGKAATAGTGIGLNNIRERLQLLYGNRASLTVAENPPGGTKVTITVPYVAQTGDDATMPA